jgi:hypothetical protein
MQGKAGRASPGERMLSLALLCVLVLVAASVLYRQQTPNPALVQNTALDESGAASGSQAQEGLDLAALAGDKLKPMSQAESFNPDTLYHKINGKADLYLKAGFKSLKAQRLALAGGGETWCESLLYEMDSPSGAFAVYGQQRRPNAQPLDYYGQGYRSKNALYLTRGPYYLEIVAASINHELAGAMEYLARAFIKAVPGAQQLNELDLFPPQGMVADSQTLLANDAFGFAGLSGVYVARYQGEAGGVLFLSRRESPDQARALMNSYVKFLKENEGVPEAAPPDIPGAELLEVIGLYELVFTSGLLLCGVHEADSPEAAANLARSLIARIKEQQP